jgi:hypothetical protein
MMIFRDGTGRKASDDSLIRTLPRDLDRCAARHVSDLSLSALLFGHILMCRDPTGI